MSTPKLLSTLFLVGLGAQCLVWWKTNLSPLPSNPLARSTRCLPQCWNGCSLSHELFGGIYHRPSAVWKFHWLRSAEDQWTCPSRSTIRRLCQRIANRKGEFYSAKLHRQGGGWRQDKSTLQCGGPHQRNLFDSARKKPHMVSDGKTDRPKQPGGGGGVSNYICRSSFFFTAGLLLTR